MGFCLFFRVTLFPQTCAIHVQHLAAAVTKAQLVITTFTRWQYRMSSLKRLMKVSATWPVCFCLDVCALTRVDAFPITFHKVLASLSGGPGKTRAIKRKQCYVLSMMERNTTLLQMDRSNQWKHRPNDHPRSHHRYTIWNINTSHYYIYIHAYICMSTYNTRT